MTFRVQVLIGALLAGILGPALGIYANNSHERWINIPAGLMSLTGVALMLHALWWRSPARKQPGNQK